jgi:hypothetical protein
MVTITWTAHARFVLQGKLRDWDEQEISYGIDDSYSWPLEFSHIVWRENIRSLLELKVFCSLAERGIVRRRTG